MARDPRYDTLFEPVRIGPVIAKNCFYQVPHCNGMGHAMPEAHAAMRGIKAEGGWAVVATEECEIHPSSDVSPYVEARLWEYDDIPALAMICESFHRHGALAAVELAHNGPSASNFYSREALIAPSHQPSKHGYPQQARAMTRRDIAEYRRWHREAAVRAKRAGFDVVYIYAAHDLSLAMHFLQKRRNQRSDEYGGSLENRARLLRELIEDTKEAVGDRCAVALRFAAEGNTEDTHTCRAQNRASVTTGLDRVRERAKAQRKEKFTTLLHHVDIDLLRRAYFQLKRKAAPGVDRVTWQAYGERLEANLVELHDRVHRGAYRAPPSRRVYIEKDDGRKRPLVANTACRKALDRFGAGFGLLALSAGSVGVTEGSVDNANKPNPAPNPSSRAIRRPARSRRLRA